MTKQHNKTEVMNLESCIVEKLSYAYPLALLMERIIRMPSLFIETARGF
jgi:hypothetical protein